jgi:hypothetical protein
VCLPLIISDLNTTILRVLQFNKELDFFATPLKKSIPTALCSQTQARKKMKALQSNAFIFFLARLIGNFCNFTEPTLRACILSSRQELVVGSRI